MATSETAKIHNLIQQFDSVSLGDLDKLLLQRQDRKFFFHIFKLPILLEKLQNDFLVLDINGQRIHNYLSVYYDTINLEMYHAHHNQKGNRYKIRLRTYLDSDISFCEIKIKNNKNYTIKKRTSISKEEISKNLFPEDFINRYTPYKFQEIAPKMTISFGRITLTDKAFTQRLTFDINVTFNNGENTRTLNNLVIAELKQMRYNNASVVLQIFKKEEIRSIKISKYCIGTALLNHTVKHNRFKEQLLRIEEISNMLL